MMKALRIAALAALALVGAGAGAFWLNDRQERAAFAHVETIERGASFRDAALIGEAKRLPVAAAYLTSPYEYQRNPSFCGPTSAAAVLRSTGRGATQESVLEGSARQPVLGILPMGMTLDEEAALLQHATGKPVTILRDVDPAAFRAHLARVNDPGVRYVINFHRGPMFGRGHGHFSPILGYLADRDLVLVGDVNEDYGFYLVESARLFEAMDTIDSATKKKRGLLLVSLQ